jgi:hypothetical protein
MYPPKKIGFVIFAVCLWALFSVGCATQLAPQVTYQGRLANDAGTPLSGSYQLTFRLYDQETGGTALYSETDSVTVENGLFDTVVGPGAAVAGLAPEDLAKPLWLEVTVSDGTVTETLTPRQRLYGAPYAFTLMPGTIISSTMPTNLYQPNGINGVVTIYNAYDGDPNSDPALPALKIVSESGLELSSPTNSFGTIYSDQSQTGSDLFIRSQDNMQLYIDDDDNEQGVFAVIGTPGTCTINDGGNLACTGTKSASVQVQEEPRLLYAIESPEVWFEDFGLGTLQDGVAVVSIDPLFAETVNLDAYHVFVTPLGDCQGLYVTDKTATGFEVRELGGGTANISFDYRIVAHRLGYEALRLEADTSVMFNIEGD